MSGTLTAAFLAAHLNCGVLAMPPLDDNLLFGKPNWNDPIIKIVDLDDMTTICGKMGVDIYAIRYQRLYGCAKFDTIIIAKIDNRFVSKEFQQCIFWHEIAHYHGWGENHPNVIFWRGT